MQHTKIKCVPNPFWIRFCCNTRGSRSITKRPPGKIHLKCYIAHSVLLLKTISQATIHACDNDTAQSKK